MPDPQARAPKRLVDAIRRKNALFVVGTGVSMACSSWKGGPPIVANWTGLLEHGINESFSQLENAQSKADYLRLLRTPSLENLLAIGGLIEARLCGMDRSHTRWRNWLEDTVGSLKVVNSELPQVLRRLGAGRLATCNYDSLLTQDSDWKPVSWLNEVDFRKVLMHEFPGVLHLQGYYADPESVVLGPAGYEAVINDGNAKKRREQLATTSNMVFVGFGAGMSDPTLQRLFDWLFYEQKGGGANHFQLVRESDIKSTGQRDINLVSYGEAYTDLPRFLRQLAVDSGIEVEPEPVTSPPVKSSSTEVGVVDKPEKDELKLYVSTKLLEQTLSDEGRFPKDWGHRALYCGTSGARAWRGVCQEAGYKKHQVKCREQLVRLVQAHPFSRDALGSMVSLGAGDGIGDAALRDALPGGKSLSYIPVDLSEGMLYMAASECDYRVAFGILGDFEDSFPFVRRTIEQRVFSNPKACLFTLLGNTFGNLDKGQASLLERLSLMMRAQDRLLLDVAVKGPKWSLTADPGGDVAGLLKSQPRRTWIANGIRRMLGESPPEGSGLRKWVKIETRSFNDAAGGGQSSLEVLGSHAFDLMITRDTKDLRLLRVCRFEWEPLGKFISNFFDVVGCERDVDVTDDGMVRSGAFLLSSRKAHSR